ncbi:antibiotic biosynthesis monooxygenase [soil metagenome]
MIIVAGHLIIDPSDRQTYLDGAQDIIASARSAVGCLDFSMTADLIEPGRINVYERWETTAAVEAFRGDGPDDSQWEQITDATVDQFQVTHMQSLTGSDGK